MSPHQPGAGCAREPAPSIFLALGILLSVGHILLLPTDALPREARDMAPSSSWAPSPVGKAFQGIFKVPIFAGGIWTALLGTWGLGAGGMLLAEQQP